MCVKNKHVPTPRLSYNEAIEKGYISKETTSKKEYNGVPDKEVHRLMNNKTLIEYVKKVGVRRWLSKKH